ncbi:transporter [Actinomadura vinacea]|uniref:Transporter n=1 Tax=Actinomadura vinacea TaxID=115336 RepID=A0ABP5X633_9ACTN
MIWLTWRQFRAGAAMMAAALAVLAAVLGLTGPGLADEYSTASASCAAQSDDCRRIFDQLFGANQNAFLAVSAVALVLPAIIGLFWGAPLITRELEAGTHRLVWQQSITRTRWLAVKLGLTGLAAMTAAGLGSLAVTWWAAPIDKTNPEDFARIAPLVFGTRGIVPIGYAAFAFALGVTIGMLVRRTLPAMAITLAAFAAVQVAMPLLVRPHLLSPTSTTTVVSMSNLDSLILGDDRRLRVTVNAPTGGWLRSSHTVDRSGRAVETIPGPCPPSPEGPETCLAQIERLGYRQQVTYHPSSRFWAFQWLETGIYIVLSLGLAAFCFWWTRRRLS